MAAGGDADKEVLAVGFDFVREFAFGVDSDAEDFDSVYFFVRLGELVEDVFFEWIGLLDGLPGFWG